MKCSIVFQQIQASHPDKECLVVTSEWFPKCIEVTSKTKEDTNKPIKQICAYVLCSSFPLFTIFAVIILNLDRVISHQNIIKLSELITMEW